MSEIVGLLRANDFLRRDGILLEQSSRRRCFGLTLFLDLDFVSFKVVEPAFNWNPCNLTTKCSSLARTYIVRSSFGYVK